MRSYKYGILEHFAHIASHDMQEPLRTVGNYLSLIQKQMGSDLNTDLTEYFKFVTEAAKRMKSLIDSLLIYSQVGRAVEKMVRTDFNVAFNSLMGVIEKSLPCGVFRLWRTQRYFASSAGMPIFFA